MLERAGSPHRRRQAGIMNATATPVKSQVLELMYLFPTYPEERWLGVKNFHHTSGEAVPRVMIMAKFSNVAQPRVRWSYS